MKKSIWVIERGEYSDYRVVGVFSSKENAELVLSKMSRGAYDEPTISEWMLDPTVDNLNKGMAVYTVMMLINGDTESIEKDGWMDGDGGFYIWKRGHARPLLPDCLRAVMWAKSEKHAVKIANEKRAQMIASGEWK